METVQAILAVWSFVATYLACKYYEKCRLLQSAGDELYTHFTLVTKSARRLLEDEHYYKEMQEAAKQHKAANK